VLSLFKKVIRPYYYNYTNYYNFIAYIKYKVILIKEILIKLYILYIIIRPPTIRT